MYNIKLLFTNASSLLGLVLSRVKSIVTYNDICMHCINIRISFTLIKYILYYIKL